jgi:putative SbcD/Mre11-related phosphoesterase
MVKYIFIGKTLFFPKEKIVAIGDLHLGYEESLKARGIEIPIQQFKEATHELEKTLKHIKATQGKIEKIIFLGDIKHGFNQLYTEKKYLHELLKILRNYVENENRIIFIKGNHEKNEKNEKFLDFYIEKDIAFTHGHKDFLELYDKKINLIIIGHLHPTITLRDKMKIKKEKYKCFFIGEYKKKKVIILPSFLSITEGISAEEFSENERDFSIIPQKELLKFEVFACQELGVKALDFGKLSSLQ